MYIIPLNLHRKGLKLREATCFAHDERTSKVGAVAAQQVQEWPGALPGRETEADGDLAGQCEAAGLHICISVTLSCSLCSKAGSKYDHSDYPVSVNCLVFK